MLKLFKFVEFNILSNLWIHKPGPGLDTYPNHKFWPNFNGQKSLLKLMHQISTDNFEPQNPCNKRRKNNWIVLRQKPQLIMVVPELNGEGGGEEGIICPFCFKHRTHFLSPWLASRNNPRPHFQNACEMTSPQRVIGEVNSTKKPVYYY